MIAALNDHRRHDTEGERAMVGANESNINRRFAVPTLGGGRGAGQQLP